MLGDHAAHLVGADLRALLANHAAHFVGADLRTLLGDHAAHLVGADLRTGFANVAANRVRHLSLDDVRLVAAALDRLRLHFRNPNSLARLARRALDFDNSAGARHVDATAAAGIPFPATWILDTFLRDTSGALGDLSFPTATVDLDGLRVGNLRANGFADFASASLLNRLAHVVADRALLGFPNRLADVVAHRLLLGFPNRLADRVAHRLLLGFPNGLADRVTHRLLLGFPYRLADGVTHRLLLGFPNRLADRVAHCLLLGFPNGLANGVVASPELGLANGLADRVRAIAIVRFLFVANAVHSTVLINRFANCLHACRLLVFPNDTATSLHHCVRMRTTNGRCVLRTTALIAGRAEISAVRGLSRHHEHHSHEQRQPHFCSHFVTPNTHVLKGFWYTANHSPAHSAGSLRHDVCLFRVRAHFREALHVTHVTSFVAVRLLNRPVHQNA